jgi:tetratricopeptide (TPR) repeat protein
MAQTIPVRVGGYEFLGRVVGGDGTPVGTCFQVGSGVLVTALHVLADLGASAIGDVLGVGPVGGGAVHEATVERVDEVHDLAVLRTQCALAQSCSEMAVSDTVREDVSVTIAGFPTVEDEGHDYALLTSGGAWRGPVLRDGVLWARVQADAVMPGMSGAPVLRVSDRAVVGVVSGRYMSQDGWLAGAVWVSRAEDLLPLLDGLAAPTVDDGLPPGGLLDLVLSVSQSEVRLTGCGEDVSAPHHGVQPGLANALHDVRRERGRPRAQVRDLTEADPAPGVVSLRRAGELLAESFLSVPIAQALARVLRRAQRVHVPVRVGIEAPGRWSLPWEALPEPVTGRPLVMHDLVSVYRKVPAAGSRSAPAAGPLRIVVAIASPETGGGPLLDYERELGSVLDAVHRAHRSRAVVRIVPFATTEAIRAVLDEDTTHILHLSAHGSPGILHLEDDQGQARAVDAETLVREAIPEGRMPRVISLAACYTDAEGEDGAGSFAAQLAERGVGAIVATQTSVTDVYATRLFARVYAELAGSRSPDVVAAVARARRTVQQELAGDSQPVAQLVAGMDEWSVVSVLAAAPSVTVVDSDAPPVARVESVPDLGELLARPVGQFVGRRHAQRTLPQQLAAEAVSGALLHGIGGIGKTTLAAEVVRRLLDVSAAWRLVTVSGELTVDGVLAAVAGAARRDLLRRQEFAGERAAAVQAAERVDLPWQDRFALLREVILAGTAILMVVDNFEDNLVRDPGAEHGWSVTDGAVAGLLAAWAASPGHSRLLVTCRYRFALPGPAAGRLHAYQVPPLSLAETRKLLWSLPRLDRYTADIEAQERIWRTVGGHPRALEYLDALLPDQAGGHAGQGRFDDITQRLHTAVERRLDHAQTTAWLTQERTLDGALADTVTLAADDVLLTEHLTHLAAIPDAVRLLAGISVYREPVDTNALLFQIGDANPDMVITSSREAFEQIQDLPTRYHLEPAQPPDARDLPKAPFSLPDNLAGLVRHLATTSLITTLDDGRVVMHRWTATELHEHWNTRQGPHHQPGLVSDAHQAAAKYWRWRVAVWPQNAAAALHDLDETRHHLLAAGDLDVAGTVTEYICSQLDTWGAWDRETGLVHDTLRWLPADSLRRPAWYHQLGNLAQNRGDYGEAERRYRQSLTIKEELGDWGGAARNYHQLGVLAQNFGDYVEAKRRYEQSPSIFEELGDRGGAARNYYELGVLAQYRGDYDEAECRHQQSLMIKEELGNRGGAASSYYQLGVLAQELGDYVEAERRYRQSLTIFEELGDRVGAATTTSQLGNLHAETDCLAEAVALHCQALATRLEIGVPQASNNINCLVELREQLSEKAFDDAASTVFDDQSLQVLKTMLTQAANSPHPAGGACPTRRTMASNDSSTSSIGRSGMNTSQSTATTNPTPNSADDDTRTSSSAGRSPESTPACSVSAITPIACSRSRISVCCHSRLVRHISDNSSWANAR